MSKTLTTVIGDESPLTNSAERAREERRRKGFNWGLVVAVCCCSAFWFLALFGAWP